MKMNCKLLSSCFLCAALGFMTNITSKPLTSKALTYSRTQNQPAIESWNYKHWTRVNEKPVKMEASIAAMCAPASSLPKYDSPHRDKFIVVYVNEVGRKAMLTEKNPQFPQGSAIVKEKLPSENSKLPELVTSMVKREKGYNPAGNDWDFMVMDITGKTVEAGKLEKCIACHTAKRSGDFVFRNYLPNEVLIKLKD